MSAKCAQDFFPQENTTAAFRS